MLIGLALLFELTFQTGIGETIFATGTMHGMYRSVARYTAVWVCTTGTGSPGVRHRHRPVRHDMTDLRYCILGLGPGPVPVQLYARYN